MQKVILWRVIFWLQDHDLNKRGGPLGDEIYKIQTLTFG